MLIQIEPVAIYGCRFKTKEEAQDFISQSGAWSWIVGTIKFNQQNLPGLERFSPDTWIVGFEMKLGETFEKYETLWNETFSDSYNYNEPPIVATGAIYVRIPNELNE